MRKSLFAAAALGLAVASPGFAQTSGSSRPGTAAAPGASGQSQAQQQQTPRAHPVNQGQIRKQLSQAGFEDIRILDTAFLVQARTRDGNPVVMMINPPDLARMSQGDTSGQSRTGAPGAMPGQGATGSGGTSGGSSSTGGSSGRTQ
jgi:hypothetical protein